MFFRDSGGMWLLRERKISFVGRIEAAYSQVAGLQDRWEREEIWGKLLSPQRCSPGVCPHHVLFLGHTFLEDPPESPPPSSRGCSFQLWAESLRWFPKLSLRPKYFSWTLRLCFLLISSFIHHFFHSTKEKTGWNGGRVEEGRVLWA